MSLATINVIYVGHSLLEIKDIIAQSVKTLIYAKSATSLDRRGMPIGISKRLMEDS